MPFIYKFTVNNRLSPSYVEEVPYVVENAYDAALSLAYEVYGTDRVYVEDPVSSTLPTTYVVARRDNADREVLGTLTLVRVFKLADGLVCGSCGRCALLVCDRCAPASPGKD